MNPTPHTPTSTAAADAAPQPNTAEAASLYQRLRGHLAVLKCTTRPKPSRWCFDHAHRTA